MKSKYITLLLFIGLASLAAVFWWLYVSAEPAATNTQSASSTATSFTEQEEGFVEITEPVPVGYGGAYTDVELQNWERPEGPVRVGLQVGHLDNDQVPEELSNLTRNGAGATWGDLTEREVMAEIVTIAAAELRADDIVVDVLPATVPPGYVADVFVSVHADGSSDASIRGYKVADFSHDYSGLSRFLAESVRAAYESGTGLPEDDRITYRMTGYYAFNWWRYEYAVHPLTPAIILETGFLTNAADRETIVDQPEVAAASLVAGIRDYLTSDFTNQAMRREIMLPTPPFVGTYECLEHRREEDPCRPGLVNDHGQRFGLVVDEAVVDDFSIGQTITVDGVFSPMVAVRDLSWYGFDIRGLIEVDGIR